MRILRPIRGGGAAGLAGSALMLLACGRNSTPQKFPIGAESLLDEFRRSTPPSSGAYDSLFQYFVLGWQTYQLRDGAGAAYPGFPSTHGPAADQIEGFARLAPLVAAWISSGRPHTVHLYGGQSVDLMLDDWCRGPAGA